MRFQAFFASFLVVFLSAISNAGAASFDTRARAALLMDAESGMVLLAKNAEQPYPPASMSKLMTLYILFEALQNGQLSLEEELVVSEKAWRMGGSKMFVNVGTKISVENLLRGVIVQSGNDACIVLAEGLAGTEEEFARRMNAKAAEIGLRNSHFANSTGWPHPEHKMSMRDLATLTHKLINGFPEFYPMFSETDFKWENIAQKNRNPLLYMDIGADGLKTGHTEESGYGLVGSAVRNNRRQILVMTGLKSAAERSQEAERMMAWGFREFENISIQDPAAEIGTVDVWIGQRDEVRVSAGEGFVITLPFGQRSKIRTSIVYDHAAPAPIRRGDKVAHLRIDVPRAEPALIPLVAMENVEKGGYLKRLRGGLAVLWHRAARALFPPRTARPAG